MCSVKGFVNYIVLSVISGSNWKSCNISFMNKGGLLYYILFIPSSIEEHLSCF